MAHPRVAEAAVIGVTDQRWGERPLAYVVLASDRPASVATDETSTTTKLDLLAFLEQRVPRWWLPDEVVFLDQIPRTSAGKFDKRQLRDSVAAAQPAS
jgi:fatty-acyl-CoA synthase